MTKNKTKYLGSKIIILVSISFLILATAATLLIYSILEDNTSTKIKYINNASFNFFCQNLDKTFLQIEKCGDLYCEEIIKSITANELANKYNVLTKTLFFSNDAISEVTVCLLPNVNFSNLISYNYFVNNNLETVTNLDTSSDFFHKLLTNSMISYPIKYQKKYWADPHYSLFIPSMPIVGTLSIPIININNNELYGIILLSFRMKYLDDIISKFNLGGNTYNILLGNYGNIGIHPLEKYLMIPTEYGFNVPFTNVMKNQYNNENKNNKLKVLKIDSIGIFKCNNSTALSYKLRNNWRLLTILDENLVDTYNKSIIQKLLLTLIMFCILFFIIMVIGINKLLDNFKQLVTQLVYFKDYDLLDWKLPNYKSNDDVGILTKTLNVLHKAYSNVQNKLTDLTTENSKLTFTKIQIDEKIQNAIQEETEALMNQNQFLNTQLNNTLELMQLGKNVCSTLNIESISKLIYKQLEQFMPVAFFGIYIFNREKAELYCEQGITNGQITPNISLKIIEKNTIAVRCFDENEPIAINNFDVEYRNYLLVSAYNPININCASQYYDVITNEDEKIAVFNIQCKEKSVFKNFDSEFLTTLKTYLNISINNIITYNKLKKKLEQTNAEHEKLIKIEKNASINKLSKEIINEIKNPTKLISNFSIISEELIRDINQNMELYKITSNQEIGKKIENMMQNVEINMKKIKENTQKIENTIKIY